MNLASSKEESSSESESVESDSSDEVIVVNKKGTKTAEPARSNVDLLLDLDDCKFCTINIISWLINILQDQAKECGDFKIYFSFQLFF